MSVLSMSRSPFLMQTWYTDCPFRSVTIDPLNHCNNCFSRRLSCFFTALHIKYIIRLSSVCPPCTWRYSATSFCMFTIASKGETRLCHGLCLNHLNWTAGGGGGGGGGGGVVLKKYTVIICVWTIWKRYLRHWTPTFEIYFQVVWITLKPRQLIVEYYGTPLSLYTN